MPDTYLTRQTLLKRLKSKSNEEAWEEFVTFYRNFIYSIINKMGICSADCDDLSQKVLLKVWKSLENFDYDQKQGQFRNWLYTVTKNTVLTHISDSQYSNHAKEQLEFSHGKNLQHPEIDKIIESEWEKHISEQAFNIVRKDVSVQMLDAFQSSLRGEPIPETATRLGIEENTVYRYKNRVKQRLMAEIRNLRELLE